MSAAKKYAHLAGATTAVELSSERGSVAEAASALDRAAGVVSADQLGTMLITRVGYRSDVPDAIAVRKVSRAAAAAKSAPTQDKASSPLAHLLRAGAALRSASATAAGKTVATHAAAPESEPPAATIFYKKGAASAAAFRPWYWSYDSERDAPRSVRSGRKAKAESRRSSS